MATLPISTIEDALAERGLDTQFTALNEEGTSFIITGGSTQVEILDGVDGGSFRCEDVAEVIVYGSGNEFRDATPAFDSVETVEEFLKAVADIFA